MARSLERSLKPFSLLLIQRTVNVVDEKGAVSDDGIDWCSELMAHRCIEPVSNSHRLLELELPVVKLVVQLGKLRGRFRFRLQQLCAMLKLQLATLAFG